MGLFFNKDKPKPKGKVISLLNQKGGVGKTTMAFNIAHALAKQGEKRVLCIDMDPQANLSLLCSGGVSLEKDNNIFHLLINSIRELKALHTPSVFTDIVVRGETIDLLPSGEELSGFELSVAGISSPRQLILKRFLEKSNILNFYDYVVIDGPPTLGLLVVNILCATDGLLVPFRPDEFSRKGLGHLYGVLENIEDMGIAETPTILAHIPNLVDYRRKQEGQDLEKILGDLKEQFDVPKVVDPFYNRASLVKSQAEKKSVFEFKGKEFDKLQGQFRHIAGLIETWKEEGKSL
ncbi:MAG: ParA family protein [Bdellovibrionota bacterium]|nr:ParA family protein [Bdellovibrionota bacterium]